jgi:outer membrane protein insertion porin family
MANAEQTSKGPGKAAAFAAVFFGFLAVWVASPVDAQQPQDAGPVRVDSVVVEGNVRVPAANIVGLLGIQPGQSITFRDVQRGLKELLNSGQFRDAVVRARGAGGAVLVIEVEEQPILRRVTITGLDNVPAREVRDTTGLNTGFPLSHQSVLDAKAYIRSELSTEGIPFAQITDRIVELENNEVELVLDVAEGQRITVAQLEFSGNERLSDGDLAGAMSVKPEGFWWFRSGSYDQTNLVVDLQESLPRLYRSRGFLDFQVMSDTLIVDPNTGKSRVEIAVREGEQYRLGTFTVEGNTVFDDDQLRALFLREEGGILQSLGLQGPDEDVRTGQIFDGEAFNEAIQVAMERYRNRGYLYIEVNPVVDVVEGDNGGPPTVNATWQVTEGQPAVVNRVTIEGNDYTYDWVIRNQVFVVPGDVYNQDLLIRSYQNVSALGFFESPMPFPDIEPLENGDVDVTFHVVEKQTGSIQFGTSVGGGVGLSGFIGYEQPNLFGQAKAGTLRWDFGRYLNSFELSYTDPALFQSRVSGTLSLFNSRDRFFQFSSGRRRRIGANLRVGFPWLGSRSTRIFFGYGISRTKYELFTDVDDTSLFGRPPGVQSQFSVGLTRTTLDHPLFPTVGSRQNINVEQNGGLLGGDGNFTRVLGDGTFWVPVGRLGGGDTGGGVRFALGLTLRGGAVFGDASAFPFERFWMGGVQFGQNLRGYDETSITPFGWFPERSDVISDIDRLGDAFFSLTAEYAIRLSDQIGIGAFYDAGSVWQDPRDFDTTRLFRGAGFGAQIVTPFGPIGLDYAYGFDKAEPGWQLHFRMGPGF